MNRWKGAVYALNPQNPDAARHFCTSAREIFTEFIELKAPDNAVFQFNPNVSKTDRGNATRREKIKYMMHGKRLDDSVTDFADADITNILELFHVLSDGTHGAAGRYQFSALVQVKRRVEQGNRLPVRYFCLMINFGPYLGKNSMGILIWQFVTFKLVITLQILFYHLPWSRLSDFPVIYEYASGLWVLLDVIIGIAGSIVIYKMINKPVDRLAEKAEKKLLGKSV